MKFTATILSDSEIEAVHGQSLRILSEIGVRFLGERALPVLEKAGAKVDYDTRVARIPADLVTQALETAPKSFTLSARNSAYDLALPSLESYYCIDGTAAFTQDFLTGERRYGTAKDIENALRVFQQMDLGRMAWAPTCASDKPSNSRALHEFLGMAMHSSKHGEHELHSTAQVPYLIEGLLAIEGSEERLKKRHAYSLIYCPVAPLSHDGEMLDAYLELGEWDLPVMIMPMPVTGSTGPASLFANTCQGVAEDLSAIVIYQLAHPGRPMIFSTATGILDFTTGGFLGGVPEMGMMSAAMVQMGRFYDLPVTAAGCTADTKLPGAEAVFQKLISTLPPVMAGADLIIGTGEIESDQLLVLEQLVVDNEIGHQCRRIARGIDCSPDKHLYEDIVQIGSGGHFLKAKSTRAASRSEEFHFSRAWYHGSYDGWLSAGKPEMYGIARQKVQEILDAPPVDPLAEDVQGRLDEILRRADRELQD